MKGFLLLRFINFFVNQTKKSTLKSTTMLFYAFFLYGYGRLFLSTHLGYAILPNTEKRYRF